MTDELMIVMIHRTIYYILSGTGLYHNTMANCPNTGPISCLTAFFLYKIITECFGLILPIQGIIKMHVKSA